MAVILTTALAAAAFTVGGAIYDQVWKAPETERRDKAMQKLSEEKEKYNKEKQAALEYVNYQLKLHQDAMSNFNDIDAALERYNELQVSLGTPESKREFRPEPKLSDYYVPSNEKINTDYIMIIGSGIVAGFIVYAYL
jgi:hypothetical protein